MKNILVTGASGNLGKATVEKFLAVGLHVIAIVSPGKNKEYTTENAVSVYEADLTNEKEVTVLVQQIITKHRTIDAAVLTVGGFAMGSIETTDGTAIQKMLTLNFHTAYFISRPLLKHMLLNQFGRIILIGAKPSLVADEGLNAIAYTLSKTLIFKLAELLNAEGAKQNVLTSVIVPSIIDTPTNRTAMPNADFSQWVSPEKIANAIHLLITDREKMLTNPVLKMYSN